MFAMAVHGGAGAWEESHHEAALAGVRRAVEAGAAVLRGGGAALDAVVAAALVLEDDPHFNAGTGATLTLRGEVECDACVMTGHDLGAGAVAAVRGVKNPVLLARRVMEETDHVLLAGEGAEALAKAWNLFTGNEPVPFRLERWKKAIAELPRDADPANPRRLAALLQAHPELGATRRGTIGAVALDAAGRTAVATSTGGVLLKLPGRVGDTPIPGAGSYATAGGAASATGRGELMMRALTTRTACDRMESGLGADAAAASALAHTARIAGSDLGLITVDARGGVGAAHATRFMPHAFAVDGQAVVARLAAHTASGYAAP